MKRILLFTLAAGLLTACGPSSNPSDHNTSDSTKVDVQDTAAVQPQEKRYTVTAQFTASKSECPGGARIGNTTPNAWTEPWKNHMFYIKEGWENADSLPAIDSAMTDAEGKLTLNLKPGQYGLMLVEHTLPQKLHRNRYSNGSSYQDRDGCYRRWWKKPLLKIDVKDGPVALGKVQFDFPCEIQIPCSCLFMIPRP